jgi:hypothetical protein
MNNIAPTPRNKIVPSWEILAAWSFRGLIVITAVLHLLQGVWLYALLCLLALGLMSLPPLLARTNQVNIPWEIELLVLWWLVTDMTIGRLMGLYQDSVWYDKVIHLGNSGLLGIVAFLVIYTLKMMGRLAAAQGWWEFKEGIA